MASQYLQGMVTISFQLIIVLNCQLDYENIYIENTTFMVSNGLLKYGLILLLLKFSIEELMLIFNPNDC